MCKCIINILRGKQVIVCLRICNISLMYVNCYHDLCVVGLQTNFFIEIRVHTQNNIGVNFLSQFNETLIVSHAYLKLHFICQPLIQDRNLLTYLKITKHYSQSVHKCTYNIYTKTLFLELINNMFIFFVNFLIYFNFFFKSVVFLIYNFQTS